MNGGVTPAKLEEARRLAALAQQGADYFVVHEVVECLSSDDEDAGEEDLPEAERSSAFQKKLRVQRERAEAQKVAEDARAAGERGKYEAQQEQQEQQQQQGGDV